MSDSPTLVTAEILDELNAAYLDGIADHELGSVQYGSGHYVFHEIDGHHYILRTDGMGFQYGWEVNKLEYDVWLAGIEAEYSELDD